MPEIVGLAPADGWPRLGDVPPAALNDVRLQLHHAVQIVVAAAISYLPPAADDSHTNLEWSATHQALAGRSLPSIFATRVVLHPATLALGIVGEAGAVRSSFPLDGRTIDEAYEWLAREVAASGLPPERLTAHKHYQIPPHPVGTGAPFSLGDGEPCREMCRWWSAYSGLLEEVAGATPGASTVRVWPHHFDMATLIALPPLSDGGVRSIGVGLSPGDDSYALPYEYVAPHPYAPGGELPPMTDGGHWHTSGWFAAILTGAELVAAGETVAQQRRAAAFTAAAIVACRQLLGV